MFRKDPNLMVKRRKEAVQEGRMKRLHDGNSSRLLRRTGFTVLELMAVMGIVSTLAAIILPAVGSAREAARRMQCVNQLKQVGIALHSYHEVCGSFPAGWQWESTSSSAYGWAVPLLPYVEQNAIYEQTDRNSVLTHPTNTRVRATAIGLLLCPSDLTEPTFLLSWEDEVANTSGPLFDLPSASYIGVFGTLEADETTPAPPGDGTFVEHRTVRLVDLERGASNTTITGERTMARVPSTWLGVDRQGADAACRLVGNMLTSPNCDTCDECEFSSRHPGGANFLWADGRVSLVSENVDSREYQRMSRRSEY
jgi:prepilin-type processing-associated H-X9-DG protein/prepilin-type N-terminal cleavage/methylation domain-containing protein